MSSQIEITKEIIKYINHYGYQKDPVVKNYYIKMVSNDLQVDEEVIVAKINHFLYNNYQIPEVRLKETNLGKDKYQKAEESILSIACTNLILRNVLKEIYLSLFINAKQFKSINDNKYYI